ncbi:SusC/RagA family TonB-linked outer membrane protein [Mucilaginibacter phyllosphaerae]|uniref:SusC/RagA family TonB-linked outer membrane protein n=2 Tax=Mucilaginibacter phyllosphaerae TaxID=1812349 RepID=A0A4Y8A670_9SPHI|nr:SusC/RagA family TonB-linked outer membrane protein [Mucilaginibacter phyllosphaerae]GGH22744.1 SusC/RagA family TonB-linked outer membrane protein [Mucilaginibacter phyllosphaerae]
MSMNRLFLLIILIFNVAIASAQTKTVTGTVTAKSDKGPLPGVSVRVKGAQTGTVTDANGKFTINVSAGGNTLVFSFLGFTSQEVVVGNQSVVNVQLAESNQQLGEVVVTALGISRQAKSLGYAAQQIKGENLTMTRQQDFNTALAGKVAGVQILGGSGAKFGASTVRIRGINSLQGGNPIYVVNGVVTDPNAINNDDVESLTVLKGPAATALYGQRASEGAVVITLKKGSAKGFGISVNQTTTFEKVYTLPKYQNEYGGGADQEFQTYTYDPANDPAYLKQFNGTKYYDYSVDESWGPKMDGTLYAPWYFWDPSNPDFGKLKPFVAQPNNVRDFYKTGVATNNNVAFSQSGDKYNARLSYTNLNRTGVSPNTKQLRNNVSFNGDLKITPKLTVSANINVFQENLKNVPAEGYGTQTSGSFNQWFHRDLEIGKLKNYQRPDGTFTTWNITGPADLTPKYWDNPYTEAYVNTSEANNNRLYGNLTAAYNIRKDLKVSVIARGDYLNRDANSRVGSYTINPDEYAENSYQYKEYDYVASLEYDHMFGKDLSLRAGAYGESRQDVTKYLTSSTVGGLAIPELYTVGNSLDRPSTATIHSTKVVNSLYGYASLGYKQFLYLDLNVRNDVSSALPKANNSYVYGGASGSFVFTESGLIEKNNFLTFGKLRASVAKVGSDIDPYQVGQTYNLSTVPYGSSPVQFVPNSLPNANLEPTLSTSYELGTELHFLRGDRIRFDFNYYHRNTKNQILPLPVNGTTGYSTILINAGSIVNHGIEISLGGTPVKTSNFVYDASFNIAFNRNKVVSLYPNFNTLRTSPEGGGGATLSGYQGAGASGFGFVGSPSFAVNSVVGKPYGELIGSGFVRDGAGNIVVDADGFPERNDNVNLGNILPKFTGGFTNSVTYKGVMVGFSFDFQYGGKFVSVTQQNLAGSGLGASTVGNNDKGNPKRDDPANGGGTLVKGVHEDGTPNTTYVDTRTLNEGYYSAIWEQYTYDATYIKLREVSIGYNLPKKWFGRTPLQTARFSIVSQNPWLIYTKARVKGIDPSQLQTSFYEGGQLPATRTLGFNLNLTF